MYRLGRCYLIGVSDEITGQYMLRHTSAEVNIYFAELIPPRSSLEKATGPVFTSSTGRYPTTYLGAKNNDN